MSAQWFNLSLNFSFYLNFLDFAWHFEILYEKFKIATVYWKSCFEKKGKGREKLVNGFYGFRMKRR